MIVSAHVERFQDQNRLAMSQAYAIGSLVRVAFHDPKKFPKAKDFLQEKAKRFEDPMAAQAFMRNLFGKQL